MKRIAGYRRLGVAVATALLAASCVLGPILGPIGLSTGFDISEVGYARSEFFLVFPANSYSSDTPLTADGMWTVTPDPEQAEYRTRIVVHRPADPADFNGTVVVEWLNVTAGFDLANDWVMAHNDMIRNGYAWVGVSAQAVGVNSIKAQNPARYGGLRHPGDSFSYDIFTHAGQQIRTNPRILGGLTPEHLIATGESQSASRLVTYVNAMQPLYGVYDGFMIHSRGSGASDLRQPPLDEIEPPRPTFIRDDVGVPVMVVEAEGDVMGSYHAARQPDSTSIRSWEIAGTAHADSYTVSVGVTDRGDGAGTALMFDRMRNPQALGCAKPINAGPHWLVLQAAFAALEDWVRNGVAPASAPLLEVESTDPVTLARDELGNALGGIRTPHVDVPIATIDGSNSGAGFCQLFGSTTPLSTDQLAVLYPTHEDFVAAWTAAVNDTVAAGFILAADAPALIAAAENSTVPN